MSTTIRMRQSLAAGLRLVALAGLLGGCAAQPKQVAVQEPPGGAQAPATAADEARPAPAPAVDVADDVLGTAVLDSVDTLLQRGLAHVVPHLPPPLRALVQPAQIKQQLFTLLGRAPALAPAIDAQRPVALALADPKAYPGRGMGPLMVALPITSKDGFLDGLRQVIPIETTRGSDHVFGQPPAAVHVRFVDGYALLAGHEALLHGAAGVLVPLVKNPIPAGVRLQLDMARLYARYKAPIERGLTMAEALPASSSATSPLRFLRFVRSTRAVALDARLEPTDIDVVLEAHAEPTGDLTEFLGKLNAGPAWGARYLPADSGFVMLSRQSEALRAQNIERLEATLAGLLAKGQRDGKQAPVVSARWREALTAVYKHLHGEQAAALWSTAEGGLGFGGVFRTDAPQELREAMVRLMEVLGQDFAPLVGRLALDAQLKGAGIGIKVRRNGFRAEGIKGDLIEVHVKWPRVTKHVARKVFKTDNVKEARQRLQRIQRGMRVLFGPRPTFALVTINSSEGPVGLMTFGKDYAARMGAMIAIARGGPPSTMAKTVQDYVGGNRKLVGFGYAPVATLIEQTLRVADRVTTVPPDLASFMRNLLPASGSDVPVAGWVESGKHQLSLKLRVSADLVGLLTRAAGAMFMRARGGPTPP